MKPNVNAIDWHSSIATKFDGNYSNRRDFKERNLIWTSLITKYGTHDANVLDLGCGSGMFTQCAANFCNSVTAADGSSEMLELCEKRIGHCSNIQLIQAEFFDVPARLTMNYDLILCSSVLEYIPNFRKAIETLINILQDEGVIIFSIPNMTSIYRKCAKNLYKYFGIPRYYEFVCSTPSESELENVLNAAHFEILERKCYAMHRYLYPFFPHLSSSDRFGNMVVYAIKRMK